MNQAHSLYSCYSLTSFYDERKRKHQKQTTGILWRILLHPRSPSPVLSLLLLNIILIGVRRLPGESDGPLRDHIQDSGQRAAVTGLRETTGWRQIKQQLLFTEAAQRGVNDGGQEVAAQGSWAQRRQPVQDLFGFSCVVKQALLTSGWHWLGVIPYLEWSYDGYIYVRLLLTECTKCQN